MTWGGDLSIRLGEETLSADSRFGFGWLGDNLRPDAPLLVAVHGSERDHLATRDAFAELADSHGLNVLAPLFPKGVAEQGYDDGYKFLVEDDIDYIDLLDAMVSQFSAMTGALPARFFLFGFSGGAQFAQRYAVFKAQQLRGLVLAAPGAVTLLDARLEWWPGLAHAERAIGRQPDLEALKRVPVAVTVGCNDVSAGPVRSDPATRNGSLHADAAGDTRLERARRLHQSFSALGGTSLLIEIPDTDHKLLPNAQAASTIIAQWLDATSTSTKVRDYNG